MSTQKPRIPAAHGRHRFSISTKLMQDYGIETPVCGATQLVTAKGAGGRQEVFSIGSDRHIHHFRRNEEGRNEGGRWSRRCLPWQAVSMAVVLQRDGSEKVYFAQLTDSQDGAGKAASVYELENGGREPQRRLHGRFVTTDPNVYGLGPLSGVHLDDGSDLLVTTLATHPGNDSSSWLVLFGHRSSTGALSLGSGRSLGDGRGVTAERVEVAPQDPGSIRWPHVALLLLDKGRLRLELGTRAGVLLQSRGVALPELVDVVDAKIVRDRRGNHKIFALDRRHRLFVLCQIGGGGERPPRFPAQWIELDCIQRDGSRPALRRLYPQRRGDGSLEVFALDAQDRLWSITERPERRDLPRSPRGDVALEAWGRLHDLGIHAAHLGAAPRLGQRAEVFAVSRQNQLLWLRRDQLENWRLERVGWDALDSERHRIQLYRTGLTVLDESHCAVAGVPVSITATERMPTTVNGLSYAIGPSDAVEVTTNAFGLISVTFETTDERPAPSLSFQAGFMDGQLDVNPERKAQLYLADTGAAPRTHGGEMHLIPQDTVLEPDSRCDGEPDVDELTNES